MFLFLRICFLGLVERFVNPYDFVVHLKKKILVRPRLGFLFGFFFRNFFGLFHSLICWLWKLCSFNIVRSLSISLKLRFTISMDYTPKVCSVYSELVGRFWVTFFFRFKLVDSTVENYLKKWKRIATLCQKEKDWITIWPTSQIASGRILKRKWLSSIIFYHVTFLIRKNPNKGRLKEIKKTFPLPKGNKIVCEVLNVCLNLR